MPFGNKWTSAVTDDQCHVAPNPYGTCLQRVCFSEIDLLNAFLQRLDSAMCPTREPRLVPVCWEAAMITFPTYTILCKSKQELPLSLDSWSIWYLFPYLILLQVRDDTGNR
jgi:hypothetical protein